MRPIVWAVLLILTPTLCAQTGPPVPYDQSHLQKLGDTIPMRQLLIPPKAAQELQRSQDARRSGDLRSSAQHLEKALQIYPHSLDVHNSLGARYFELHEYEKAVLEFQKAIEIDPRVVQPFNNLSATLFVLHRYSDAEAAARRALDLDPHHSSSRYLLGCSLTKEKRNPLEAMEVLRQSEREFPGAKLLLAEVLLSRGAVAEAENDLRDYLKVPGVEKKQKVECWLAQLTQASVTTKCSTLPDTP